MGSLYLYVYFTILSLCVQIILAFLINHTQKFKYQPGLLKVKNQVCSPHRTQFIRKHREENQLDAIECFIALIICLTCFGHLYSHHQELETILVLLPHMVRNALVARRRLLGAEQQAVCPG